MSPLLALTSEWILGLQLGFTQYAPCFIPLSSAYITIDWVVDGSVFDINRFTDPPLPFGFLGDLSVDATSFLWFPATPGSAIILPKSQRLVVGPHSPLAPNQFATFDASVFGRTSLYIDASADLALLAGSNGVTLNFQGHLSGETFFGSTALRGSVVNAKLTYNVPAHESTLGCIAITLLGFIASWRVRGPLGRVR